MSRFIFEKVSAAFNDEVTVKLKNQCITGVLIAFTPGNAEMNETFIIKWHLVPTHERYTFGRGALGSTGITFLQSEIESIFFKEDNFYLHLI
ncbi:MAG: hypothetical protein J0L66_06660 [Cytophagales bacterium]|nr:hypothetical protein [Cytophagales bacterium]